MSSRLNVGGHNIERKHLRAVKALKKAFQDLYEGVFALCLREEPTLEMMRMNHHMRLPLPLFLIEEVRILPIVLPLSCPLDPSSFISHILISPLLLYSYSVFCFP